MAAEERVTPPGGGKAGHKQADPLLVNVTPRVLRAVRVDLNAVPARVLKRTTHFILCRVALEVVGSERARPGTTARVGARGHDPRPSGPRSGNGGPSGRPMWSRPGTRSTPPGVATRHVAIAGKVQTIPTCRGLPLACSGSGSRLSSGRPHSTAGCKSPLPREYDPLTSISAPCGVARRDGLRPPIGARRVRQGISARCVCARASSKRQDHQHWAAGKHRAASDRASRIMPVRRSTHALSRPPG